MPIMIHIIIRVIENHNQLDLKIKYTVKDTIMAKIKVTSRKIAKPFQNMSVVSDFVVERSLGGAMGVTLEKSLKYFSLLVTDGINSDPL